MSGGARTDVAERVAKAERIIAFLRQRYPVKTAENVAADIGGCVETIQKMIDRVSAPSAWTYGRLVCAYGPSFLCSALANPPGWIVAAAHAERLASVEAELTRITAELASLKS
ncbi:hypothetical protein DK26_23320 [Bosea sp. WAO]|nr:hypothetical protein DK26_23320 [Bosea sp. WAO]